MRLVGYGCAGLLALALALAIAFGVALVAGLARLPLTNVDRIVTQHTLAYVQTHQKVVLDYYADYLAAPDDAHKRSAVLQGCAEAATLDKSEWPDQAVGWLTSSCR